MSEPLPGLGCRADRQDALWAEVCPIGRHAVEARVRPAAIVEIEIPADPVSRVRHAVGGGQIDLLVFHAAPEPPDEDVVPPNSLAIPAELDFIVEQNIRKRPSCEL